MVTLLDVHFDKGNGALFSVVHNGHHVRCFVAQDNSFLTHKLSPGQTFPSIFERYAKLIAAAAVSNIERQGVSQDPWGNVITSSDLDAAQHAKRTTA